MQQVLSETMTRSTVRRLRRATTAQQLQEVIAASEGEVVLRRDLRDHASPGGQRLTRDIAALADACGWVSGW